MTGEWGFPDLDTRWIGSRYSGVERSASAEQVTTDARPRTPTLPEGVWHEVRYVGKHLPLRYEDEVSIKVVGEEIQVLSLTRTPQMAWLLPIRYLSSFSLARACSPEFGAGLDGDFAVIRDARRPKI
jgi:hypothetical protein